MSHGAKPAAYSDIETRTSHVPLTHGMFAMIDAADWAIVAGIAWHCAETKPGYVYASGKVGDKNVRMHQILAGPGTGLVDHRNRDTLDNRRENLRRCGHAGNAQNCRTPTNNTSGYKGVHFQKANRKWVAYICGGGKKKRHLGIFTSPKAAARAYDVAAVAAFGEFARPNFPRKELKAIESH